MGDGWHGDDAGADLADSSAVDVVSPQDVEEALDTFAPLIARTLNQNVTMRASQSWCGPLPRPDDLEHFERILPGAAHRIVAMAEKAVETSSTVETTLAKGDVAAVQRGQYLSTFVTGITLGLAILCVALGQPAVALGFLGVPVLQFSSRLIRAVREPVGDPAEQPERESTT